MAVADPPAVEASITGSSANTDWGNAQTKERLNKESFPNNFDFFK